MSYAIALSESFKQPRFWLILLSDKILPWLVAAISGIILMFYCAVQQAKGLQSQSVNPQQQAILDAQNNLVNLRLQIQQSREQVDLNPAVPQNYGYDQALLFAEANALKERVAAQRADKNHSNYLKPWALIWQELVANEMNELAAASAGQSAAYKAVDNRTGQKFEQIVSPEERATRALQRLQAIDIAQNNEVIPTVSLEEVAKDVAGQQVLLKQAQSALLKSQGLAPVAVQLDNQDIYGDRVTQGYEAHEQPDIQMMP